MSYRKLQAWAEPYYHALSIAITLFLALTLAVAAGRAAYDQAQAEAAGRFEFRALQITEAIRGRMLDYEQVLRGASGLFAASVTVERAEWARYFRALRLAENYPGINALGYAPYLPARELPQAVARARKDNFPAYEVYPAGEREHHTPILYLEPLVDRHLRALGYDMYSDDTRRGAMRRAHDRAAAAISGKVILITETETNPQPGFLMFVPVYETGAAIGTTAQRRKALRGFVFAQFRMHDLMRGMLGSDLDLRLEIYDGPQSAPQALLYDSIAAPGQPAAATEPAFETTAHFVVQGRTWTVRASSLPGFEARIDRSGPAVVLLAGIVISFLLTALIWLLSSRRRRAVALAHRMTAELRASREQLSFALEGSNLASFDWDVATGVIVLSERWNTMLGGGYEPVTTTVTSLQALLHPDDLPHARDELENLISGKTRFYDVEYRVRTLAGDWKWMLNRAKVVERDPAGAALRITGTHADISERKEMEQMKDEFIATVSHELRTPLTALIGALAMAKEEAGSGLAPDAAMFLDMASQNGERLAALINDILDLEKIESGRMDLELKILDVGEFLHHALDINRAYADRHGVYFKLADPLPAVSVNADPDRLLQILTNLLSNAAKFSPQGGSIRVAAEAIEGSVRVSVTDEGPGIPEEFRGRIFGKFEQADGSDTRQKGGTGLGLSICKALVEKMGGHIGFQSAPGAGATFWFELPRCSPTAS